jgi:hypothetical protein
VSFLEEVEALLEVGPEGQQIRLIGMRGSEGLKASVGQASGKDFDGKMRGRRNTLPTARSLIFWLLRRNWHVAVVAAR